MTPPTFDEATPAVLAHSALHSLAFIGMAASTLGLSWARLSDYERAHILTEIEDRASSVSNHLMVLLEVSLGRRVAGLTHAEQAGDLS